MPEGPEMRRAADEIAAVLLNKKAQSVSFGLPGLKQYDEPLTGRRITSVECRGKAVIIGFGGGQNVFTHNQLYGRWYIKPLGKRPKTNRQLRLTIDTNQHSALLYSASNIAVLDKQELSDHPYLKKLGPEALDNSFTPSGLVKRLKDSRFKGRGLASLYLDQGFLGGIGNYLRSEILFVARISPFKKPNELNLGELKRLAKASLDITRRSYKTAGITNSPKYVKALKAKGVTRGAYRFFVFARAGRPCHVCGTKIEKTTLAGRRLYYCGSCQSP